MKWACLLPLLALVACEPEPEPAPEEDPDLGEGTACPFDEDDDPANATEGGEGFLCPVGDVDWVEVKVKQDLLRVQLELDAPVSPVQPTYTVYAKDGETVVARTEAGESAPLDVVHDVGSGDYLVLVRDLGGDNEDVRHSYTVGFETLAEPDPSEPNDLSDEASAAPTEELEGYIASRGDEDWFEIDLPANGLIAVDLDSPRADYEPSFRIEDDEGNLLFEVSNPSGSVQSTNLAHTLALVDAGTYFVIVHDDDGLDYDVDTPYTLEIIVGNDPDINEPNDHPLEAVQIGAPTCTTEWSTLFTSDGTIASSGDVDWFAIDPSDCLEGVLEVSVLFDKGKWSYPNKFDPELRVVREVPGQGCAVDQDCQALNIGCGDDMDCSGWGNQCLGSGTCAGSGMCLPGGVCGATFLSEPDIDTVSVPAWSDRLYLGVGDRLGDAHAPTHHYEIQARVRQDRDLTEPNDRYTGGPPLGNSAGDHQSLAVDIPVHDCSPLNPEPDCCTPDNFVTGYLSWTYDQDWFRYPNPCPSNDCMVRIHFVQERGPVDFYTRVFTNNSMWFDNISDAVELAIQPDNVGMFGGLDPTDECFYSFRNHNNYYLTVRDTIFVNGSNPQGGTWDSSTDQSYSLCVEKIEDMCLDPCVEYPNGCGTP